MKTKAKVKNTVCSRFGMAILALLIPCEIASADVIYRETFSFCGKNGSAAAALSANWQALREGKTLGRPGYLKVFAPGSPKQLDSINANPQGESEGHAFWSKATRSMLFVTDEYQVDVRDLHRISFHQRLDAKIDGRPRDESRIALLIGDTWYISDLFRRQHHVGFWEPVSFHPHEITYGTSDYVPGHGAARPKNSGVKLPTTGVVSMFGIYAIKIRDRVRYDNYTIENFKQSDIDPKPDLPSRQCSYTTAIPRYCKNTRYDEVSYKFKRAAKKRILRKLKGKNSKSHRDRAIISLLMSNSLNNRQIADLNINDYLPGNTFSNILLTGSSSQDALVLSSSTSIFFSSYLNEAAEELVANGPLFLFYSKIHKNFIAQKMCPVEVHRTVRRRAKRAGVWEKIRIKRKH